jgi:cell division protein ZapA (FtsZ GTPase activity inhibitor)
MKNLFFAFALLCSTSLVAQFSYNANGSGIQSPSNTASGNYSTAMGYDTNASGPYSTAMGNNTEASGYGSTAMGIQTTASGGDSTAMGSGTTASGDYSTAMGSVTQASGDGSTAMGASTTASGSYSTASGGATTAEDYLSFAIGVHNETDETPNPEIFSYQNTAFVIGNGGYDIEGSYVGTSDTFSNAFEVLFDGTTTIAGDLNINSDARLKANIISLGATLSKLLQIDGKTYTMKKDTNHKKKIGLLAQDIEKVFPELVTETNDIKSVNYQGLVPVLINAMKEQQDEIERLKKQDDINDKLQQEIDELKAMVKQFISK